MIGPIEDLVGELPDEPQRMVGRDLLLNRHIGVKGDAELAHFVGPMFYSRKALRVFR